MKILITGGSGFIGTNMVEHFVNKGDEVLNIDWNAPQNSDHQKYWENVDILDYAKLETAITKFAPDYVVHLAARTDLYGKTLDDYKSNTVGFGARKFCSGLGLNDVELLVFTVL